MMMSSKPDIRQQNAERRLRHATWIEPTGNATAIWTGLAFGLFVVLFFAVRA